jgi:hypothetical protein
MPDFIIRTVAKVRGTRALMVVSIDPSKNVHCEWVTLSKSTGKLRRGFFLRSLARWSTEQSNKNQAKFTAVM